jgi:hypothetical protein
MSKFIGIFLNFFLLKNTNLGAHFRYWNFLITSIFKSLNFLKWFPIFDSSPRHQFVKFNNFLWVYWSLGKFFFSFCIPRLKAWQPVLPWLVRCPKVEQKFWVVFPVLSIVKKLPIIINSTQHDQWVINDCKWTE